MGLEAKLVQKLGQSLLMTPQLQQAIKLLQLGRLEYKEAIEKELLENPILEEMRDEEPRGNSDSQELPSVSASEPSPLVEGDSQNSEPTNKSTDKSPADWENYLESLSDWRGSASPRGLVDHEDRPSLEATLTKDETIQEHLLGQLRFISIEDRDREILLHLMGNLNKDGYLDATYEEIAAATNGTVLDVERVIEIVKTLDPPGVAARDLRECLLFQLEQKGLLDALEGRIVRDHLEKLERRRFDQIAKIENVSTEEVSKAVEAIQTLEPRPGRQFADESIRYVVPDIYVSKDGNDYVISLNEDGLPKLRVSPYYLQLLRNTDAENVPNKQYLAERLKAASWLIKSIHQRQQTIYKVTESIVKFQKEFLEHGIERMKPLVLKDVADDIGMHESTVSRVTTNKFVHTPQGVYELKFFFTTGIKTTGGDVSSSAIKEKIKNLVASEPPGKPISDQEIVELLKKENIDIARRTVAKYRESLGIESSSRRKRLF